MNIASIEIGTQTSRLLVAEWKSDSSDFKPLLRERVHTRLGAGASSGTNKRVTEPAVKRGVEALKVFSRIIAGFNVVKYRTVATGILRMAENGKEVIDIFENKTGIRAEIISGEREAWLTMRGVKYSLGLERRDCLIFDVGGGSTEFIMDAGKGFRVKSIPLGCVELKERFFLKDPPNRGDLNRMMSYIDDALGVIFDSGEFGSPELVIGTGGSVTNIGSILHGIPFNELTPERADGIKVTREKIKELFRELINRSQDEREKIPGIDPERADVLPAGAGIVIKIMDRIGSDEMIVCLSDILDGILVELINPDCNRK